MQTTTAPMLSACAYWPMNPGTRSSSVASRSPSVTLPTALASTEITVMPICTVARKRPGSRASSSLARDRLEIEAVPEVGRRLARLVIGIGADDRAQRFPDAAQHVRHRLGSDICLIEAERDRDLVHQREPDDAHGTRGYGPIADGDVAHGNAEIETGVVLAQHAQEFGTSHRAAGALAELGGDLVH